MAERTLCGYCGQQPEEHGDSDDGPMTVCPLPRTRTDGVAMTKEYAPCRLRDRWRRFVRRWVLRSYGDDETWKSSRG